MNRSCRAGESLLIAAEVYCRAICLTSENSATPHTRLCSRDQGQERAYKRRATLCIADTRLRDIEIKPYLRQARWHLRCVLPPANRIFVLLLKQCVVAPLGFVVSDIFGSDI